MSETSFSRSAASDDKCPSSDDNAVTIRRCYLNGLKRETPMPAMSATLRVTSVM